MTGPLYFNSANLSLCPTSVRHAMDGYRSRFEENPTQGLREVWSRLWEVQAQLGDFLGAPAKDLFFRNNVTSVLNTFLLGMSLNRGDEILTGDLEYGAIVNICRLRAQKENLSLRLIRFPTSAHEVAHLSPERVYDLIIGQIGPRTKMLLLSHVIGSYGLEIPLELIARFTRSRGILLVVDGAYAVGALPLDFRKLSDVDFYGASLYKWMMGPKGTAFGWVNPIHQEVLESVTGGWTTFDTWGAFAKFGGGSRFASRFALSGCQDFAPYLAIADTLALWGNAEDTRRRMNTLAKDFASKVVQRLGCELIRPPHPIPIVTLSLPAGEDTAQTLWKEFGLQASNVCLNGRWTLSFSFHVYNTEVEIDEAIVRLEKFTSRLKTITT